MMSTKQDINFAMQCSITKAQNMVNYHRSIKSKKITQLTTLSHTWMDSYTTPNSDMLMKRCWTLLGPRSTFVTKIRMQKILVILRLYWNPIILVVIWKVLRQAFMWYFYFWNPSLFGWVISLFCHFFKIPSIFKGLTCPPSHLNSHRFVDQATDPWVLHVRSWFTGGSTVISCEGKRKPFDCVIKASCPIGDAVCIWSIYYTVSSYCDSSF
jgi:hypothetical protein